MGRRDASRLAAGPAPQGVRAQTNDKEQHGGLVSRPRIALTDEELKELIQKLTEEEEKISYRRRILHGKIDILRAELVNRLRKKHEEGEA